MKERTFGEREVSGRICEEVFDDDDVFVFFMWKWLLIDVECVRI